ncbi:MFS transporter [Bacillus sp. FJAT-45350]|uniref:MFS transporter n=1 Tax=Bacillus sp. FJAT-45350 TaxID=2011014 RepID=UPI0015CCDDEB|nr:MFS transporter [Bacillus sp. FJAT-45350]
MTHSSILKNTIFMRMFSSYSISMLGRWFDMVAIMILFGYVWEVEPLIIALIPVAYALPHALLSQFAGILADRNSKIKLMVIADVLTAVFTVALFFAPHPWVALTILLLRATLTVIHYPAQQGLIKDVVEEKLIVKAVTLNGTMNEFTKIMGPFIGGSLAAAFSPKLCILINAFAYFISALILLTIIKNKQTQEKSAVDKEMCSQTPFWTSWCEGWLAVLNNRILVVSFAFSIVGYIGIQIVDVQIIVLFREIAPSRPELIGWLMAASGAGAFIMMLVMNKYNKVKSYGWTFGGSLSLIGVGFGGVGFLYVGIPSYVPIILGFIAGLGVGLFTAGISYLLQKESTKENIGRISGIYNSLTGMIVLVAPLIGGILISLWKVSTVYQAIGISLTIIGFTGIVLKRILWRHGVNDGEKAHLNFVESTQSIEN